MFGDDTIFLPAEDEADGRLIAGVPEAIVYGGKIEVHFACGLGREVAGFQIHDEETAEV